MISLATTFYKHSLLFAIFVALMKENMSFASAVKESMLIMKQKLISNTIPFLYRVSYRLTSLLEDFFTLTAFI